MSSLRSSLALVIPLHSSSFLNNVYSIDAAHWTPFTSNLRLIALTTGIITMSLFTALHPIDHYRLFVYYMLKPCVSHPAHIVLVIDALLFVLDPASHPQSLPNVFIQRNPNNAEQIICPLHYRKTTIPCMRTDLRIYKKQLLQCCYTYCKSSYIAFVSLLLN